jgi:hypothetical protein
MMVMKIDKSGGVFIRVKLTDEALIQWYEQQPERGKSEAVSAVIAQGVRVEEGQRFVIDCTVQELLQRVNSLEIDLKMTQLATLDMRCEIDQQIEPHISELATRLEALEDLASADNNNLVDVDQHLIAN